MDATQKTKKSLRKQVTILSSLLVLTVLLLWATFGCNSEKCVQTNNIVSFLANVSANSYQKVFTVVIGTKQATPTELNNLLRPEGGKIFIVTSITSFHITPKIEAPFSVIALLAVTEKGSTRGWGAGSLSVTGRNTTHVTYRPGLVVELRDVESLAVRSFIQSNETAHVEVHGYLMERPGSKK